MYDATDSAIFAQEPLTLTSPADSRIYANSNSAEPPGPTILEFFDLAL